MNTDQLLLTLIVAACPGSLFVGAIGAILAMRMIGVRWPWEQQRNQQQKPEERFGRWDRKTIRMGAKHIVSVVLREREKGWVYTGQAEDGPGIWDLQFIRRVD